MGRARERETVSRVSTALEKLAGRLRVPVERVPVLGQYDEGHVLAFEQIVHDAMEREEDAFTRALEEALEFVPRLLRPVAKKMLGGGRG